MRQLGTTIRWDSAKRKLGAVRSRVLPRSHAFCTCWCVARERINAHLCALIVVTVLFTGCDRLTAAQTPRDPDLRSAHVAMYPAYDTTRAPRAVIVHASATSSARWPADSPTMNAYAAAGCCTAMLPSMEDQGQWPCEWMLRTQHAGYAAA